MMALLKSDAARWPQEAVSPGLGHGPSGVWPDPGPPGRLWAHLTAERYLLL